MFKISMFEHISIWGGLTLGKCFKKIPVYLFYQKGLFLFKINELIYIFSQG